MDTVTRSNGKAGVRSKRSTTARSRDQRSANGPDEGSPSAGRAKPALQDLQEALNRATARLERAEEDLDTANQRLDDAGAARRHLLENVASGGDEARRRFASVLHDDVLQQLTAAELQLELARAEAADTKYAPALDQLKETLKVVEESLRDLLFNVSPAAQDAHLNLTDALRDRILALKMHTGIEPDLDIRLPKRVSDSLRTIVFRNVSEALSNVEKHANATRVSVKVRTGDGGIEAQVADDGIGFVVTESLYLPGHLGLVAMRERAHLAGGWCRIESEPGRGAEVTFWIPNGS